MQQFQLIDIENYKHNVNIHELDFMQTPTVINNTIYYNLLTLTIYLLRQTNFNSK